MGREVVILNPKVGQGKLTFKKSIRQHLPEEGVRTITPDQGSMLTRASWGAMRALYGRAATPGIFNELYVRGRERGSSGGAGGMLVYAANREVLRELRGFTGRVLTMHGLYGKGLPHRFFAEGDVYPDPEAVDPNTHLLVPHNDTKEQIAQIAQQRGVSPEVTVTGFIIPQELLQEGRREKIELVYATGEPDEKNPLRIAYIMTGQMAHKQELYENVLGDRKVKKMISDGRVKLDVYLWNSRKTAEEAYKVAVENNLSATLTCEYNPLDPKGVQLFWHKDPRMAIHGKFAMGGEADLILTPPAENIGWLATTPTVLLEPVAGNPKMIANKQWAERNGLVIPGGIGDLGATIDYLIGDKGAGAKRYFDQAGTVFDGLTNGAKNIAEIVTGKVA